MKELYIENYKTLRKKLKKINTDTIRKDTPCLWIGRITIVKMSILPKTSTDFLQFLSNSNDIFHRTSANILKFMWDHKRSWIAWKYWERRKKLEVSSSLISNYITKLKNIWYLHRNRNRDEWKRTETSEINFHIYRILIYDKEAKNIQWRKDRLFSKWYWENWAATCRRMKLDHYLTP